MSYSNILSYDSSGAFAFDSTLVEVASSTLRLLDLGASTYSTADPVTTSQHALMMATFTSFAESATKPAGSEIKYQLVINGSNYYYSSTATLWVASDGTYSQSNTATEVNANLSTLVANLGLTADFYVGLRVLLHSNGSARPALTSNTFGYTFTNPSAAVINTCQLYGYLNDLLGAIPTYDATKPTTLIVSSDKAFFHGTKLIMPFTKTANFNSAGLVQLSVIETATPGMKLQVSISFYEGLSRKVVKLYNSIIPNTATLSINNLTTTQAMDFG